MPWFKKKYQSGQAVLVVLLVVAVALGYGLSIISQSVTDTEITGHSEESARVFNAAEAGIENALGKISSLTIGTGYNLSVGDVNVQYSVSGNNFLEAVYQENDTATVVLGGVAETLTIEWADGDCSGAVAASGQTPASLLVTVIDSNNQIKRYGWNACNLDAQNGLTYVSAAGDDGYLRKKELVVAASDELVKVRPIYNQAQIRVSGDNLPVQAYGIDSKAQSPTLESKAIQVSRTVPATPAIFDYVLFSGTNIVQ